MTTRLIEEIARGMASSDGKGAFWEQYERHVRVVIEGLIHGMGSRDSFDTPDGESVINILSGILDEKAS